MSHLIRRKLTVTTTRLQTQLADVPDYPADLVGDTEQEQLDNLVDKLEDLKIASEAIGISVNLINGSHKAWNDLVTEMEPDERKAEQTIMEKFVAEEAADAVKLIDEAQAKGHELDKQRKKLESAMRKLTRKIEKAAKDAEKASSDDRRKSGGAPEAVSDAHASAARLPKLDLPRFNGDLLEWPTFWEFYYNAIHTNPKIGNRERFTYLHTCLEGPAKQTIEGLSLTDKNYGIAIDLLKERFGKEDAIKQALHKELRELKKPDSSAAGLRRFLQRLERLCRQLEEFGEELDSNEILFNLQAKLPTDI